jgi:hypothetical protein
MMLTQLVMLEYWIVPSYHWGAGTCAAAGAEIARTNTSRTKLPRVIVRISMRSPSHGPGWPDGARPERRPQMAAWAGRDREVHLRVRLSAGSIA